MRRSSDLWPNVREASRMGWDFCQKRRKEAYGLAVSEMLSLFWFVNLSGCSGDK